MVCRVLFVVVLHFGVLCFDVCVVCGVFCCCGCVSYGSRCWLLFVVWHVVLLLSVVLLFVHVLCRSLVFRMFVVGRARRAASLSALML